MHGWIGSTKSQHIPVALSDSAYLKLVLVCGGCPGIFRSNDKLLNLTALNEIYRVAGSKVPNRNYRHQMAAKKKRLKICGTAECFCSTKTLRSRKALPHHQLTAVPPHTCCPPPIAGSRKSAYRLNYMCTYANRYGAPPAHLRDDLRNDAHTLSAKVISTTFIYLAFAGDERRPPWGLRVLSHVFTIPFRRFLAGALSCANGLHVELHHAREQENHWVRAIPQVPEDTPPAATDA